MSCNFVSTRVSMSVTDFDVLSTLFKQNSKLFSFTLLKTQAFTFEFLPTTSFFFFIFFEYLKTLNTEKPWFFHSAQQMPLETRVTKTVVCLVGLTKVAYIIVYDQ